MNKCRIDVWEKGSKKWIKTYELLWDEDDSDSCIYDKLVRLVKEHYNFEDCIVTCMNPTHKHAPNNGRTLTEENSNE